MKLIGYVVLQNITYPPEWTIQSSGWVNLNKKFYSKKESAADAVYQMQHTSPEFSYKIEPVYIKD
jgi:hypothetical protein